MTSENAQPKVQCPVCNKMLSNKNNLKTHIQTIHEKKLPFLCPYDLCGKQYPNKSRFNVHLRTHLGIKPYSCTICGQSFNECGNLKAHLNKHNSTRQFTCHLCPKEYKSKGHLKEHINIIHFNIKKYECDVCLKKFGKKAILNDHLRTHTKEKPFSCPYPECNKTFAEKGNMKMHYQRHLRKDKENEKKKTSTSFKSIGGVTKAKSDDGNASIKDEDLSIENCWNDVMKDLSVGMTMGMGLMTKIEEKKTLEFKWNDHFNREDWTMFGDDKSPNESIS